MENNSIVPVKPSDNAIVRISNQLSLANKLLNDIERDKVFRFLTERPQTATSLISKYYPLNDKLLEKYKDKWNWSDLSANKALPWSETFIGKYMDKWNWEKFGLNETILLWPHSLIDKYKDKWVWGYSCPNHSFPLYKELIDKIGMNEFYRLWLTSERYGELEDGDKHGKKAEEYINQVINNIENSVYYENYKIEMAAGKDTNKWSMKEVSRQRQIVDRIFKILDDQMVNEIMGR